MWPCAGHCNYGKSLVAYSSVPEDRTRASHHDFEPLIECVTMVTIQRQHFNYVMCSRKEAAPKENLDPLMDPPPKLRITNSFENGNNDRSCCLIYPRHCQGMRHVHGSTDWQGAIATICSCGFPPAFDVIVEVKLLTPFKE